MSENYNEAIQIHENKSLIETSVTGNRMNGWMELCEWITEVVFLLSYNDTCTDICIRIEPKSE